MTEQTNQHSSILKDTREAKGLTLELVHEATKIPMDALKAIEQGYSVRILTPFYYRGFIKIYSEFLGLNAQDVFDAYNMNKPVPVVVVPASKKSPIKSGLLAPPPKKAKHPRVVKPIEDVMSGLLAPKNLNLAIRIIGGIFILFVCLKISGCMIQHFKSSPNLKNAAVVKFKDKKSQATQPVEATVPVVSKDTIKAESNGSHVELAVRAIKDSWIQVKADGKVVFAMTMQKGTMESWSADNQIELSGKNIHELDMEVNGKQIGSLGSNERKARKVLITKEGLTVKK